MKVEVRTGDLNRGGYMKRFFLIVGFPLRLVFGLAAAVAYGLIAMFNPNAAIEIPAMLHWILTAENDLYSL